MLPLWIIDLTEKTSRRDTFQNLVGKLDHVNISSRDTDSASTGQTVNPASDASLEGQNQTIRERLDNRDRREAEKKYTAIGNYWYYSQLGFDFSAIPAGYDSEKAPDLSLEEQDTIAGALYQFQERLVKAGADFIAMLRKSNCRPYQTVNIVVLGDITQRTTQLLFASVAAMLQKEKGRLLPHHIHQGMEIMGMLYIPCNVNTLDVGLRTKIQHVVKEIEVQHEAKSARGYDHVMIYQDVQNRTEAHYGTLDEREQAEFLFQCLINMYFACDSVHPLISGTTSAENFFFTMGVTSTFFDMALEDKHDCATIATNIINTFKEKGEKTETPDSSLAIFDKGCIRAEQFITIATEVDDLRIDAIETKQPSPHPIKDFLSSSLKRLYYRSYLKNYPSKLLKRIVEHIDECTREALRKVSEKRKTAYQNAACKASEAISRILSKITPANGGLPFFEDQFKDAQRILSKEKASVKAHIDDQFWFKILGGYIPSSLKRHFEEYHDAYTDDIENHTDSSQCKELKATALKDLSGHISAEPTTLSIVVRSVMAGIAFALAMVPTLNLLSPWVIDLGNVRSHAAIWYTVLFFVPALCQLIKYYLYRRKKNKYVRVLKAYFLHDAYARVANRVEIESTVFYDRLIELCDMYLKRIAELRKELHIDNQQAKIDPEIPMTKFNVNLHGGKFGDKTLIPEDKIERLRIRVIGVPTEISELNNKDYFLLINHLKDDFKTLFADVDIVENRNLVLDEATGQYIYKSRREIEEEDRLTLRDNIDKFKSHFIASIEKEVLPREHPTVCDNLLQYFKRVDYSNDFIEPMLNYTATNGEITSSSDHEYCDIKASRKVSMIFNSLIAPCSPVYQTDEFAPLYSKYLFVTRWRTFETLSLNRILPREDFDTEIRRQRVVEDPGNSQKSMPISSVLLWALFPEDDASSEWLKLFASADYNEAYDRKERLKLTMNIND